MVLMVVAVLVVVAVLYAHIGDVCVLFPRKPTHLPWKRSNGFSVLFPILFKMLN